MVNNKPVAPSTSPGTQLHASSSSGNSCTYRFISSSLADLPEERDYDIIIRQQPQRAKMSVPNERDRRPIEPPPILQMQWLNCSSDDIKKCLQSPFYYLVANLVAEEEPNSLLLPSQNYLSGSTVSSLYRLRDIDNSDGGFFVFGDLAVKKEGRYRLHFSLFEIVEGIVQNRKTLLSDAFTVFLPKRFPGPFEATFLSRTFCDQGVKMRIRKEHRLPSATSRKRRHEAAQADAHHSDTSSSQDAGHERPYKRKGGTVTLSVYAPGSHHHDVHFGRWQVPHATTQPTRAADRSPPTDKAMLAPHRNDSIPLSTVSTSSTTSSCSSSITASASNLPPLWQDHDKSVYSNSSIYSSNTYSSSPPHTAHTDAPRQPLRPTAVSASTLSYYKVESTPSYPYASASQASSPFTNQSIPSPPPSTVTTGHFTPLPQQPAPSSDLTSYHFDSQGKRETLSRQLTPPPILADIIKPELVESHQWGDRLPPLRAIMSDQQTSPLSRPLQLPAPIPSRTQQQGSVSPRSTGGHSDGRVSIQHLISSTST
ncbi:velvet factor-domain-containing protein [Syncephalastrum racemosum]|uniref:Velvet factor-domain-containing protein n=1 Tax=Syncephalastrum racemosum TaxID=13706 RepID=A0A1X2HHB3_SYNRA|nr:velvet factor-domain-containing protein [Syncephalastrum racemosum]